MKGRERIQEKQQEEKRVLREEQEKIENKRLEDNRLFNTLLNDHNKGNKENTGNKDIINIKKISDQDSREVRGGNKISRVLGEIKNEIKKINEWELLGMTKEEYMDQIKMMNEFQYQKNNSETDYRKFYN